MQGKTSGVGRRSSQTPEPRRVAAPKRFDFPDVDPKVSLRLD